MKIFSWTLTFLVALLSCNRDNNFEYPLVFTGNVINISETGATFTGNITNLGSNKILESGFIWSLYPNDNNGIKIKNEKTSTGVYSLNTNRDLFPGKTYYVRAYVQTNNSFTFGKEVTFKSPERTVDPGRWDKIFDYRIATDWSTGCDIIRANFTINDTTYTILNDAKLYCYSHADNTLKYLSETILYYHFIHFSVVYNGYAYLFETDGFYRFNPKDLSFTKLKNPELIEPAGAYSGFLMNDNIFVGIGPAKEYLKYNITDDSWQNVQSFPGGTRINSYAFSVDDIAYIGSIDNDHAWNYEAGNDKWTQRANSPFTVGYPHTCTSTMSFGYCFYYNSLYKYYPEFDYWEKLAQIDDSEGFLCYPMIFAVGENIYLVNVWNSDHTDHYNIWRYRL